MANRPAYKAKYLEALSDARAAHDRAEAFRGELARVRAVLATRGAPLVTRLAARADRRRVFIVTPLEYECLHAALLANARGVEDGPSSPRWMTIRGVPVKVRP